MYSADNFADQWVDQKISISDYSLSASVACGKFCCATVCPFLLLLPPPSSLFTSCSVISPFVRMPSAGGVRPPGYQRQEGRRRQYPNVKAVADLTGGNVGYCLDSDVFVSCETCMYAGLCIMNDLTCLPSSPKSSG